MIAIFESPKVSVCMITYNHAPYIAQAIESVLMQETDFPVELVIGEDCSTDNTRAIVREYGERYPDRIRVLLPDRNLGMIPNFVATMDACNGQYIALLEGDDYWTDPLKLQRQVDFLEAHPECSMCFHNVALLHQNGLEGLKRLPGAGAELTIEDLLLANPVSTCSVVFRHAPVEELPEWYFELIMGDWSLWVLLAQRGKLSYIDQVMGVYRVHQGGAWSGGDSLSLLSGLVKAFAVIDQHLGYQYHTFVEQGKINYLLQVSDRFLEVETSSVSLPHRVRALRELAKQHANLDPPVLRRYLRQYLTRYFFAAAQKGDYSRVIDSLPVMVFCNPTLFVNRGARSIVARVLLGESLVHALKRAVRW